MKISALRQAVIIGIGDALRLSIAEGLRKRRLSIADVLSITVPQWFYEVLRQAEGRSAPTLLGALVLPSNDWLATDEVVLSLVFPELGPVLVEFITIPTPQEAT